VSSFLRRRDDLISSYFILQKKIRPIGSELITCGGVAYGRGRMVVISHTPSGFPSGTAWRTRSNRPPARSWTPSRASSGCSGRAKMTFIWRENDTIAERASVSSASWKRGNLADAIPPLKRRKGDAIGIGNAAGRWQWQQLIRSEQARKQPCRTYISISQLPNI